MKISGNRGYGKDIDIDLTPSKRKLIFKKIREELGELRLLQVATFGTEGTKSAVLSACRGYRTEECPEGIDIDTAQYIAGLIPSERGVLWTLSEAMYGNEEKDRKPIQEFIREVDKYPGLYDIMTGIEGLVNKRSQHASGVILYNEDPWNNCAIMRSPNGDLTTQFSLHDAEALGNTKFDFLVTEICDKIAQTIELLQNDGLIEKELSLKQVYQKYLHPSVINLDDEKIWDALVNRKIVSLFQFNSDCGEQAIAAIKPRNPLEMMMANALMRLTSEKGKERPLDRYVRLKGDMNQWYRECRDCGLTEEEIKVLEPYYLPVYGCPTTQEKLLLLCMEPKLGNFSLADANAARKICAKKQLNKIPELHKKFVESCPRPIIGEYVWKTAIEPQMSYAFAEPHAIAYSYVAIQILILVTKFPEIYWNCGCLIVDSGSVDDEEENEMIEEDEQLEEEEKTEDKKKTRAPNYGKVATAIGKFMADGITILPPDINNSSYSFVPILDKNAIAYGFRGITRIPATLISAIIEGRPYTSFADFNSRIKTNKLQMVNLIKSGAFDSFGEPREQVMRDYICSIADQKQRLTLQNMQMLIDYELIPPEMAFYAKLFLFNKFLKKNKNGTWYNLNDAAINFISDNFDIDLTDLGDKILQKTWDATYKKAMDPMRDYLKANKDEMLKKLNGALVQEQWDKYATGTISKWEMDSISFYYHEHELANISFPTANFFKLPEEPQVDYTFFTKNGQEIAVYKLDFIAGTVIDKNKLKNSITLLTKDGVVNVKIYKNQYSIFDKQISERGADGKKVIRERSWFGKGNLLLVQGIRRGNDFVPKKRKDSLYPIICKITEITDNNTVKLQTERLEVGEQ